MTASNLFPEIKPDENGYMHIDALSCDLFRITGLPFLKTNKNYHRLDDRMENELSLGLKIRTNNTSGVQLTVRTDSSVIGLHAILDKPEFMEHMPDDATSSFDIYKGVGNTKKFWHVIYNNRPRSEYTEIFSTDGKEDEYSFYFPLYSGLSKLEIIINSSANLYNVTPYKIKNPILVYGSSITQGGCVSRPGNLYTSMIGRMLDVATICMGFSSNATGEDYIARSFADLELSGFVMDYDHNAPNAEHLKKTHEKFYKIIREKNPDLPIIIVSKPDFDDNPEDGLERRNVIRATYDNAVSRGDKNVYFIDGERIFDGPFRDSCTVDRNHPSDIGHMRMALVIGEVLGRALGLR